MPRTPLRPIARASAYSPPLAGSRPNYFQDVPAPRDSSFQLMAFHVEGSEHTFRQLLRAAIARAKN